MDDKIIPWAIGLFVSIVVGRIVVEIFLLSIREKAGCEDETYINFLRDKNPEQVLGKEIPPNVTGCIERLFFTTVLGFGMESIPIAMMGWLGVKMITNLNREGWAKYAIIRHRAFTGLLASMLSLLFAFIGGLICQAKIPFPPP